MYIGRPSLTRLAFFLYGYDHALREFSPSKADTFLSDFSDWIHEKFKPGIARGWEQVIDFNSADEANAVEHFWRLLDEFVEVQRTSKGGPSNSCGRTGGLPKP
jgi:hypothetical protein